MDTALRDVLRRILERAGAVALDHFREATAEHKADGSVVTEADRAVEAVLVEAIQQHFPGDGISGEEGARVPPRAGQGTWFVDPIDGTSAFLGQLAYWGPTICRIVDGRLDLGGFYVPRLAELYLAQAGAGAWRDDQRLRMTDRDVSGDDILFVPSRVHRVGIVPWRGKVRALGPSAAHLVLVAAGSGLATVIPRWNMWDVGCGALLIRESGGVIWNPRGNSLHVEDCESGLPFLAGAPTALRSIVDGGWAASVLTPRGG